MTEYTGEDIRCIVVDTEDNLTSIPEELVPKIYAIPEVTFTDLYKNAHTSLGIQCAINLNLNEFEVLGYDGYSSYITEKQHKSLENEYLFAKASEYVQLKSLLPTNYNLNVVSLYSRFS